jgi:hypothetical protein
MRTFHLLLAVTLACAQFAIAGDQPTSLNEARAAVEANIKSSEGKAFDEKLGTEFVARHLDPLRRCKQEAAGDFRSFWILLKLEKDGAVREVLFYPETKLAACARGPILNNRFLSPPRPEYWVSVYLKMSK